MVRVARAYVPPWSTSSPHCRTSAEALATVSHAPECTTVTVSKESLDPSLVVVVEVVGGGQTKKDPSQQVSNQYYLFLVSLFLQGALQSRSPPELDGTKMKTRRRKREEEEGVGHRSVMVWLTRVGTSWS